MADTTRKIYFEVEGQEALSTFEQLKKVANETARTLIESGNSYSKTGREVNNFLEQEIRLRERKSKLEYDERRITVTEDYQKAYGSAKTDSGREKATATYMGRMREVSRDERELRTQSSLLREVIETLKQNAREEIREDRKGVEEQVKLYKQGKLKDLTPEAEAKLKIQAQILGEKEVAEKHKDKSVFGEVFAATFLANLIGRQLNQVVSSKNAQESATRLIAPMMTGAGALGGALFMQSAGGAALGGAIGGIVETLVSRHHEAENEKERARLRYGGVIGNNIGLGSALGYGMTSRQITEEGSELARVRKMTGNSYNRTLDVVALQKAYSLEKGQLLEISKGERFGGGGAMQDTNTVISVLKNQGLWDKNSQAKIPEYLAMLVALQEEQIKKEGTIDNARNAVNISAMVKLGDKFARDPSYVTSMSNALANPQNEYQQARSLSVLANMKPGADLWELGTMQERGLSQKGYMSGVMKQIQSRYGKGNLRKFALSQTLGSNYSKEDINRIYEEYDKDSRLFDSGEIDKSTLDKLLKTGSNETHRLAQGRTVRVDKLTAKTEEAFLKGPITGGWELVKDTWKEIGEVSGEVLDNFKGLLGLDGSGKPIGVTQQDKDDLAAMKAGKPLKLRATTSDQTSSELMKSIKMQTETNQALLDYIKKNPQPTLENLTIPQ